MKRWQAAGAAMVALAVVGTVWSTPVLAAPFDGGVTSVYAKKDPNTGPVNPNIPNPGTVYQAGPADLKVDYVSGSSGGGSFFHTYSVTNIGTGSAFSVKVEKVVERNDFSGSHGIETETSYEELGMMAPGATKTVVIACAPHWGHPKCHSSSAESHTPTPDSNPGNNWDVSP